MENKRRNESEEERKLPVKRKKEKTESKTASKEVSKQQESKEVVGPSFCLTACGIRTKVNLELEETVNDWKLGETAHLCFEDIHRLVLLSVLKKAPYPVRWANLNQPQTLSRTVLIVFEGLSVPCMLKNIGKLSNIKKIFTHALRIVTPIEPFSATLATLQRDLSYHIQGEDTYLSVFSEKSKVKINISDVDKNLSKLHLLLTPIQLETEDFPLPGKVTLRKGKYVCTHPSYSPVSKDSPLYAIDCEMCQTINLQYEVTRIAVVNERLEVIYETLVKPRLKIIRYLTKFSGVTKQMLDNVDIKLEHVQTSLKAILPTNAILCGHSLNSDLHALKMIHPYIIDTSIIYNTSGIQGKKDSLKNLALRYLNEEIQSDESGHDPVVDAVTTMKLVQLKLNKSLAFGDATHSKGESNDECVDSKVQKTETCVEIHEDKTNKPKDKRFFAQLNEFSKKTCVIGRTESLDNYPPEVFKYKKVHKIAKPNEKEICTSTLELINSHALTITHLIFDINECENSILELNNFAKQVYDCCPDKSLNLILFPGVDETKDGINKNGLLMTVLKNIE